MRWLTVLLSYCLAFPFNATAQGGPAALISSYLDSIRQDPALLTAFFTGMPKGGDLHHHLDGSIYAETYLETVIRKNYWLNLETLEISSEKPSRKRKKWRRLQEMEKENGFPEYRERLIRRWSIKNYAYHSSKAPENHFFHTFGGFLPALPDVLEKGLLEVKNRALSENVQYLETIFSSVGCSGFDFPESNDPLLRYIQEKRDTSGLFQLFDIIMEDLEAAGFENCALQYNRQLEARHDSLNLDDEHFTLRYQLYVLRIKSPTDVFADLALNFASAAASPLVVGVNIVAPEHDPVALKDYWLHMQMFRYFSRKYPRVKKALHAGELRLGLTKPEELTWHIHAALQIAGADRIGHGVGLPYEPNWMESLTYMHDKGIAVEVNLSSNAFILAVKGRAHPLPLYLRAGVPVVIGTDDAGVLRCNTTEQLVLLASWFPEITYSDVKKMIYNSIDYSFIQEQNLKEKLRQSLDQRFEYFERSMSDWIKVNLPPR